MSITILTNDNLDDVLKQKIVIIDFWAQWCGPCQNYGPIFKEVSESYSDDNDVVFAKCDTEASPEVAQKFGIRSIPTTVFIREGVLLDSPSGVLPKDSLIQAITTIKNLDMDEVRKSLEN